MNRRDLVKSIGLLLGGSIVGGNIFINAGCRSSDTQVNAVFNESQLAYLNEIADTILPETTSPGAKAAKVGNFMALMVVDCYEEKDQKIFMDGLKTLNDLSERKYRLPFVELTKLHRTELLIALDKEQRDFQERKVKDAPSHYFRMMKELTVLGYFNSKEGVTEALRYIAVPGKFDGNYPYAKGDKAWATT